jgi:hypothetical protein
MAKTKEEMHAQLVSEIYSEAHKAMSKYFAERRNSVHTDESRLHNISAAYAGTVYSDAIDADMAQKSQKLAQNMPTGELQGLIDGARAIVWPRVDMAVRYRIPEELDKARENLDHKDTLKTQLAAEGLRAAKAHFLLLMETHEELKPRTPKNR